MVDRIRELCKEQGTSIFKLEKSLGIGNGTIARWDKSTPHFSRLQAVANALGVPVSYLTGESEQKEKPTRSGEPKNPILADIYKMLDGCSEEELNLAKARLQKIIESRGE